MPLQNRVTPTGDIEAVAARGLFTGNRGIIHDATSRALKTRRWSSPAWLTCVLDWRGVRRQVMGPGSWTELFFLDEATALAAGHRPCFLCRRAAALSFRERFPWPGAPFEARPPSGTPRAHEIDRVLHAQRLDRGRKRLHALDGPAFSLPDGAMVLQAGGPHLILGGRALPWSHAGYGPAVAAQDDARLITPPATVAVLRAGYRPILHPSAGEA